MSLIICPECSKNVSDKAVSCPNCGVPISNITATTFIKSSPDKSRNLAILFAALFGIFGLHKFYLNKPGIGFLYILISPTLLSGLIGLLEALSYLSMDENMFQERLRENKL